MAIASLDALPDDIILDILTRIPTASTVSNLSRVSRRAHALIEHDGWRTWTKRSFPTLDLPISHTNWNSVADRLTYLDRCWEKRAFLVHGYQEAHDNSYKQMKQGRSRNGRQTVGFYPVLDAQLTGAGDELLAWGAGENLVTRQRCSGGNSNNDLWGVSKGIEAGYSAGFGDITALSIVQRSETPEVLIGRLNGDIKLVHATGENSGKVTQRLTPQDIQKTGDNGSSGTSTPRRSPGQQAISWTEWQPESKMVASCKNSTINIFDLSDAERPEVEPIVHHDMTQDGPEDELALIRGAKFLSKDTVACALANTRQPVRWGKITPTGLRLLNAPNNSTALGWVSARSATEIGTKTTVRAIEPVGSSGSLLLSAWDDGTYRLMDVRTPSEDDAVYRDRWHTYDAASTLLVYGNQRFVSGGKTASRLHFFDFRYPKSYHHADALSCSQEMPTPCPPNVREGVLDNPNEACDDEHGCRCGWHQTSRAELWRPDATLHMADASCDRVHALAKSSDMASSFYCGIQGAVTEVELKLANDVTENDLLRKSAPPGWKNTRRGSPLLSNVALMETGISLCDPEYEWMIQESGNPGLWRQSRGKHKGKVATLGPTARLDAAYYEPSARY